MTQHTPGPWSAHDDDGTGTLPCVLANQVTTDGNFYVAQCNVYADAVLIAAAPDLLAGCQHIVAYVELWDKPTQDTLLAHPLLRAAYTEARAAIAKAQEANK